ncbi:AbrB/MazE/SpoVT family DNA-binding domain-containing protein [Candidatus Paracaedibacter symbiosus]|uniref:AbrB/MazE/SpoVT family DNA-binding domain-containing protein n=1 Tax=Candidatus Paracaedibacter symbiosus TaxID=244582 RepID=UPI0005096253|nr:AbrB/MazE/SpoVT family DNA-binding domain-containing protein [Candidatus Paracaedibacter symbiosus]
MDTKTVMSSRGQVVIPKMIRDIIGLHSGSELIIHLREDSVLEFKPVYKSLKDFFGKGAHRIKHENATAEVVDIDTAIAEAVSSNLSSSK